MKDEFFQVIDRLSNETLLKMFDELKQSLNFELVEPIVSDDGKKSFTVSYAPNEIVLTALGVICATLIGGRGLSKYLINADEVNICVLDIAYKYIEKESDDRSEVEGLV